MHVEILSTGQCQVNVVAVALRVTKNLAKRLKSLYNVERSAKEAKFVPQAYSASILLKAYSYRR